jgi:CheY-like chemotaxis protein
LIVEDNPHISQMYRYTLNKMAKSAPSAHVELDLQFAPNGHAAWQLLESNHFSLVMTDLYMPVLDGFELLQKIRADPRLKTLPVVVITAGNEEAIASVQRAGATRALRKPVRFVEVVEIVRSLLRIE